MTVYVESNFVLEVALGQEQADAADEILARAERGEIELALPSFSLVEPFSTITRRDRDRRKLSNALNSQAKELRRSRPHQQEAEALEPLVSMLVQVGQSQTSDLVATVERLLKVATVIQIDLPIFRSAMGYRTQYGLSEQDAIIYAAVVSHLNGNSALGPHYFANKNWKDFVDPELHEELDQFDCTFVPDFNFIQDVLSLDQSQIE